MSYTRRNVEDGVTVMNSDLYNNLQDGIDEAKNDISSVANTVEGVISSVDTIESDINTIKEDIKKTILTGVLSPNTSTLTLTSDTPTNDKKIDVYSDIYGVPLLDISIEGNTITLTFEPTDSEVNIKVVIS